MTGRPKALNVRSLKASYKSPKEIKNWQINGKIAVRTAHDSGSSNISWSQNNQNYNIDIYSLLGSNRYQLRGSPNNVRLTTPQGQTFHAKTPEQLLKKRWGYNIPVSYLTFWIRGLAAEGPHQSRFDAYHRLSQLNQAGWQIDYLDYNTIKGIQLPSKIFLTSKLMRIKMLIYQWEI